jgi:hypothetical protein
MNDVAQLSNRESLARGTFTFDRFQTASVALSRSLGFAKRVAGGELTIE